MNDDLKDMTTPDVAKMSTKNIVEKLRDEAIDDEMRFKLADEFVSRAHKMRLDFALRKLINREPFYGAMLRSVTKIKSYRVPTACVAVKDGELLLLWNPCFFMRIDPEYMDDPHKSEKIIGVLIHEMLHLIMEHLGDLRSASMSHARIRNWAQDLAINCMISPKNLPEGLLVPGRPLELPKNAELYRPQDLEAFRKLSNFVLKLPRNKSAEYYYNALMNFIEKNTPEMLNDPQWGLPNDQRHDDDEHQQGQGLGRGQGQSQDQGQGQGQNDGEIPESLRRGYGRLCDFDVHKWDEEAQDELEFARNKIKKLINDATLDVMNNTIENGWGSLPAEVSKKLIAITSKQVDWRALLKQFVGFANSISYGSTIKKINKRYPYMHPGRRRNRGALIAIYIDQSGSVSDDDLALLFGELTNLSKSTTFHVYFFDTEVDDDMIVWRRGSSVPPVRQRAGGTDFNAPTRHANERVAEYDAVIIMTDGECSKPEPSLNRRAWIVTPNKKLHFNPDKRDIVINMKKKES